MEGGKKGGMEGVQESVPQLPNLLQELYTSSNWFPSCLNRTKNWRSNTGTFGGDNDIPDAPDIPDTVIGGYLCGHIL